MARGSGSGPIDRAPDSDWWEKEARKERARRIRLEILADTIGAHAEQVRETLARDSQVMGEMLSTARETREAIAEARADLEHLEDTVTALRIHCSTSQPRSESGEHLPAPTPDAPLNADRRGKPRTIRQAIAENPLILLVIVALLGAFAVAGVKIVWPGFLSLEPPPEQGSHSVPDSPSSQPRLPEDESAVIP